MSIDAKIETLKAIAALDAELSALQSELQGERSTLTKKTDQRSELTSRVQALEGSLNEMEKTRSQLYGELRQLSVQIDKAREKLARVRNEREANAASRELEELRRIQREREKEIEKLVGLADEARVELEKAQSQEAEVSGELGDGGVRGAKLGDLEARIGAKEREREVLVGGFDKALLRRYDAVRARRGSGIAAVDRGACTACHIELAPMVYQQMMHRKELFTCPSCLRILYLAPARQSVESPSVEPPASDETSESSES